MNHSELKDAYPSVSITGSAIDTVCTHWIKPLPVVSTSHITENEGQWLRSGPRLVYEELPDGTGHLVTTCGVVPQSYPNLNSLLTAFRTLGYYWIILDGEGSVIPGIPTFDW